MFRFARESLIAQYYSGGVHKAFSYTFSVPFFTLIFAETQLSVTEFTAHEFRSFQIFLKWIGCVIYAAVGTLVTIIGRKQQQNIQAPKWFRSAAIPSSEMICTWI